MCYRLLLHLFYVLLLSSAMLQAQDSTATDKPLGRIRGQAQDLSSGAVLEGAMVEILNITPRKVAFSDGRGQFSFEALPVGRHRLRVELEGYREELINEVLVSSGKEVFLALSLEELSKREEPKVPDSLARRLQRLQTPDAHSEGLSHREFRPEEISRYAGGLNDPARLASNVAGVFNTDDSQNYLINRGNSPLGVLWRIEGVPVQNPNHFATLGNSGASFPLLNTNALGNSSMYYGGFGAEYGNAFSAVMDMHLRNGNENKHEFTLQVSLLGLEAMAEGPIKKGESSYLLTYRYSALSAITALGLPIGTSATPNYQDANLNLHFRTKRGFLKVFGMGGYSEVGLLDANINPNDLFAERGRNLYIWNWQVLGGMTYRHFLSNRTYLQATASVSHMNYLSRRDSLVRSTGGELPIYEVAEIQTYPGLSLLLNSKLNTELSTRQGLRAYAPRMFINDRFIYPRDSANYLANDWFVHLEAFSHWQWRFGRNWTLRAGVFGQYYSLNARTWAVEPRLQLSYDPHPRHRLSLAYGHYSRWPPSSLVFYVDSTRAGLAPNANRELDLFRSRQLILGHQWALAQHWQLKTEVYAQQLYNLPVAPQTGTFSLINYGDFPLFPRINGLVSEGEAYNYGLEMVLQRRWYKGVYTSLSGTYFESYYQGSDGQWRETAFNTRYIFQAIAGRETRFGKNKRHLFTTDIRLNYRGPRPFPLIDLAASQAAGYEVIDTRTGFADRLSAYKRVDFKVGARFNSKKISQYIYLDIINVLSFRNELQKRYIPERGEVLSTYQFGILPNLFYQLQF